MKKSLVLLLSFLVLALFGCSEITTKKSTTKKTTTKSTAKTTLTRKSSISSSITEEKRLKIGFITLHDQKATYDKRIIDAAKDVCIELGVQAIFKSNIPEGEECFNAAKDLVNQGCKGVFASAFGHEEFLIRAAKTYTDVEFAHANGTHAHMESLTNFHNAYASIYEGTYVNGIAAGMKLNEMITDGIISQDDAKIGYVGAFPYAEVVSCYTAFYLGAKSVCPSVTMKVRYTNSWYDENAEMATARTLIEIDNCVLISQYGESQGAPSVCEAKKIPNIPYSMENSSLVNSYLTTTRINWIPYFRYFITSIINNQTMESDWVGTLNNGSVEVFKASRIAAEGTQAAMEEAVDKLKAGTIKVFDTANFTVSYFGDGVSHFTNYYATVDSSGHVTSYLADVDSDSSFGGDTEVISDGYFHESEYRSAPYFDIRIDGITELIYN